MKIALIGQDIPMLLPALLADVPLSRALLAQPLPIDL